MPNFWVLKQVEKTYISSLAFKYIRILLFKYKFKIWNISK